MSGSFWAVLFVTLLACAILLEAYFKRNKRSKPLHEKFDATEKSSPPLGMEATDIEGFDQANRLNDNLARHNGVQTTRSTKHWFRTTVKKRSPEDHAKIFAPKDK